MNNVFSIFIYIAMVAVSIAFFLLVYKLFSKAYGKRMVVFNKINETYSKNGTMDYKRLELSRYGIMYRLKNYNLTPADYMILRILVGFFTLLLGYLVAKNFLACIVGFILGFVVVPYYFRHKNNADNEEMLMDIYNTYSNIKIQMSAGIYIRECLEYTYDMVKNPRYKAALHELILNFSDKTVSSHDAVMIFKNRFHSHEIDKLSALLASFMQYGMNSNHADDIMLEIRGIIEAKTLKTEHDIEMKAELTNFLFFGLIIAMVVYTIFTSFSTGGFL